MTEEKTQEFPEEMDSAFEGTNRSTEELKKLAEENGCELIVSDDYSLLVDLDGGEDRLTAFWKAVEMLERNGALPENRGIETWQSKSGEHYHARVKLTSPMPLLERLLLQAVLGSDPVREGLGYIRHVREIENPVVLFRPTWAVVHSGGTY